MAENNEDDDNPYRYNKLRDSKTSDEEQTSSGSLALDLGNGNSHQSQRNSDQPSTETSRKEENPFSFKHFLSQNSSTNQGARRKVYSPSNSPDPPHESSYTSRLLSSSEMSSVLPDFVQDHLVVEQCYNINSGNINNINLENIQDLEYRESNCNNLPDFAINTGQSYNHDTTKDPLPDFAVPGYFQRNGSNTSHLSTSPSVPLDLPSVDHPLPFDLPLTSEDGSSRGLPTNDSVSKSLPDFLSDGPIRQERFEDVNNTNNIQRNGLPPPEMSLPRDHTERLQMELDSLRRQLVAKNRRLELLENELHIIRTRDRRDSASLETVLHQAEQKLQDTMKKAATLENSVIKLKHENKLLKSELNLSRKENTELRLGVDPGNSTFNSRRLAQDLRTAANVAENSLRTLLNGVENLRLLASSVESKNNEQFDDFGYEDAASGPAL